MGLCLLNKSNIPADQHQPCTSELFTSRQHLHIDRTGFFVSAALFAATLLAVNAGAAAMDASSGLALAGQHGLAYANLTHCFCTNNLVAGGLM